MKKLVKTLSFNTKGKKLNHFTFFFLTLLSINVKNISNATQDPVETACSHQNHDEYFYPNHSLIKIKELPSLETDEEIEMYLHSLGIEAVWDYPTESSF